MTSNEEKVNVVIANRDVKSLKLYQRQLHVDIFRGLTVLRVIEKDDVETFTFLLDNDLAVSMFDMVNAIRKDSLKIVKLLLDRGYYKPMYLKCSVEQSLEMTKLCIDKFDYPFALLIPVAANIEILTYLFEEKGATCNMEIIIKTVSRGHLNHIPYLLDKCSTVDLKDATLLLAILDKPDREGTLAIVKYLLDKGFHYDSIMSLRVAYCGSLDIIKFFHEGDYPIHERAYSAHKDINKYLHANHLGLYRECDITCKFCHTMRMNQMIDLWYLEEYNYSFTHQWLPREMIEDIIDLSFSEHYHHIEDCLDNDYMNEEYVVNF